MKLHSGMGEVERVAGEWENAYENLKTVGAKKPIVLPNYMWVTSSGMGITHALGRLAGFLSETKLIPFNCKEKFIEFVLDYSASPDEFPAFVRYVKYLSSLAEFGEIYKGIVAIDISEWVSSGACGQKRFMRFLEYLSDNIDDQLIIFLCTETDENLIKDAESVLISFLRVRVLHIGCPTPKEFRAFMNERLKESGLRLSTPAGEILEETLSLLRTREGFDGFKTVGELVKDLIYTKYTNPVFESAVISKKDVTRFSPDGEWVKQYDAHKRIKIGF